MDSRINNSGFPLFFSLSIFSFFVFKYENVKLIISFFFQLDDYACQFPPQSILCLTPLSTVGHVHGVRSLVLLIFPINVIIKSRV